ncbi:hypothetical protein Pfo_003686 [Paulownia fortunei]|nr:hypothetical protein Pfo_003686 [Paulownia fortunei]
MKTEKWRIFSEMDKTNMNFVVLHINYEKILLKRNKQGLTFLNLSFIVFPFQFSCEILSSSLVYLFFLVKRFSRGVMLHLEKVVHPNPRKKDNGSRKGLNRHRLRQSLDLYWSRHIA